MRLALLANPSAVGSVIWTSASSHATNLDRQKQVRPFQAGNRAQAMEQSLFGIQPAKPKGSREQLGGPPGRRAAAWAAASQGLSTVPMQTRQAVSARQRRRAVGACWRRLASSAACRLAAPTPRWPPPRVYRRRPAVPESEGGTAPGGSSAAAPASWVAPRRGSRGYSTAGGERPQLCLWSPSGVRKREGASGRGWRALLQPGRRVSPCCSSGDSSATAIKLWFQGWKHSMDTKRHGTTPACASSCSLSTASVTELQSSLSTSQRIVMCTSKAGPPFSFAIFWTSAASSACGLSGGTSQQEMAAICEGPKPPPIKPGAVLSGASPRARASVRRRRRRRALRLATGCTTFAAPSEKSGLDGRPVGDFSGC